MIVHQQDDIDEANNGNEKGDNDERILPKAVLSASHIDNINRRKEPQTQTGQIKSNDNKMGKWM